jgi:hypothetical protein
MKLCFIILLSISARLFAQTTAVDDGKKWAIGLSFSPDYNYMLPYNKEYKIATLYYEERGLRSVSFGINAVYKISKRFGLELSVFYAAKGKRATNTYPWLTPTGSYDPALPGTGTSAVANYRQYRTFKYYFLEIPVKLNAYVLNKRFKIFPSLGFAANVTLGQLTMTSDNTDMANVNYKYGKAGISPVYISAIAGIGFSYDVNKRLFVKLEPNYRQFITSIVDGGVIGYFYSVGCNAGLYCRF